MVIQTYLLFVAASVVLVLVPGPDMAYMISRCVAQGRRAGVMAALGINAGAYVHLAAGVTGLSAILVTSATAFAIVKWAGAAYLVFLGIRVLMSPAGVADLTGSELVGRSLRAVFWQGFLSDVLNPKVAIFYVALLPQFINVEAGAGTQQLILLGVTGNVIAISLNLVLVAVCAALTRRLRRNARIALWLQRGMGLLFVGLGLRLASQKL